MVAIKPNRREFLNYVWAASMALTMAGAGGISLAFALPRQRRRLISLFVDQLPKPGTAPLRLPTSNEHLWITYTQEGVVALNPWCTHLRRYCFLVWSDEDSQFACPCHGSQYNLAGEYVVGPAPRAMDSHEVMAVDGNGRILARSRPGRPLALPSGTEHVYVDPDRQTQGASHS